MRMGRRPATGIRTPCASRVKDDMLFLHSEKFGTPLLGMNGEPINADNGWHVLMVDTDSGLAWDVTSMDPLGDVRVVIRRFERANPGMSVQEVDSQDALRKAMDRFFGQGD